MPTFDIVEGGSIFIPAHRILHVESGEGGLTSKVVFPSIKPHSVALIEVAHTTKACGDAIVAELEKVRL